MRKHEPLLTIEVNDLKSVPVVRYKGEELNGKVSVSYDWETKTDTDGIHKFKINHIKDQVMMIIGEEQVIACPECKGTNLNTSELYNDGHLFNVKHQCLDCSYGW